MWWKGSNPSVCAPICPLEKKGPLSEPSATSVSSPIEPWNPSPGIERVVPILKPYKLVSREFQQEDTVIEVACHRIGGKKFHVIAGPCSVESSQQVLAAACPTQAAGATFLRGGAFKPRSSPYSFQGLAEEGLGYLVSARDVTGLPIITKVLDPRNIDLVSRYADILNKSVPEICRTSSS